MHTKAKTFSKRINSIHLPVTPSVNKLSSRLHFYYIQLYGYSYMLNEAKERKNF